MYYFAPNCGSAAFTYSGFGAFWSNGFITFELSSGELKLFTNGAAGLESLGGGTDKFGGGTETFTAITPGGKLENAMKKVNRLWEGEIKLEKTCKRKK